MTTWKMCWLLKVLFSYLYSYILFGQSASEQKDHSDEVKQPFLTLYCRNIKACLLPLASDKVTKMYLHCKVGNAF